ncbi:MAG: hypothetical protein SNJ54_10300 [Anaerolineae bacterium]
MKTRWLVVVATLILVVVGAIMAQDDQGQVNDPGFNERANACFAGGSLEGKCHTTDADRDGDIDQLDVEFMWWCGWYLIRVEYKQLPMSAAPEGCYFEPAPPPTPTGAPIDDDIDDCPPYDDDEMIPTSRPLFSNEIRYDPCDEWWWEDSRD